MAMTSGMGTQQGYLRDQAVAYSQDEGDFLCPCHGGRYDATGKNVEGPPPRPLVRFPLERERGKIYVRVPV